MFRKVTLAIIAIAILSLTGCASVPMSDQAESTQAKQFPAPDPGNAGLYVYRNSFIGKSLKRDIFVDGDCLGRSANKVFFYKQVAGDKEHTIATQSEFSPNQFSLYMEAGENYFVRQYIKMGVFVGGANLEVVDANKGKEEILKLKMATGGQCRDN